MAFFKMKPLKLLWLLTLLTPLWAQEAAPTEFRYYVPLAGTKNIAAVDWNFTLEVTSREAEPFQVQILQHDSHGRVLGVQDFGIQLNNKVFRWNSLENAANRRLRSIEIVSDRPLIGQLWSTNALFGQINAAKMIDQLERELVIPYIPELYLEMSTSFAVQGVSSLGQESSLDFLLYDERNQPQQPLSLRSNLPSLGYHVATPEVTLSLSGIDAEVVPSWARVIAGGADYFLSGFQTFTREDPSTGSIQTGANELSGQGAAEGHILFSKIPELNGQNLLVLTNPAPLEITINLQLFYKDLEETIGVEILRHIDQTVVLQPFQRVNLLIGEDLFPGIDIAQKAVRLSYQAVTLSPDEELLPQPAFALHFLTDDLGRMGLSSFSLAGNRVVSWIDLSQPFDTALEIVTLGKQEIQFPENETGGEGTQDPVLITDMTRLKVTLSDEHGVLTTAVWNIAAGEMVQVMSSELGELLSGLDRSMIRIDLSVEEGAPITVNMIAFSDTDIALLNPHTFTVEAPQSEGEDTEGMQP